jgi:hypothetical protein
LAKISGFCLMARAKVLHMLSRKEARLFSLEKF